MLIPDKRTIHDRLLDARHITVLGCWSWMKYTNKSGYGKLQYKRNSYLVHRLSMFVFKDFDLTQDVMICHKCENKRCFNPEHLYIGDQSLNMKDAIIAGTHNNSRKIQCIKGHLFTGETTRINKQGHRECRICDMFAKRLRRATKRSQALA